MIKQFNLRTSRLNQHLLFWLTYLVFMFIMSMLRSNEGRNIQFHVPFEALQTTVLIIVVYVNLEILIPRVLNQKRYVSYGFLLLIVVLINSSVVVGLVRSVPQLHPPFIHKPQPSPLFILPVSIMQLLAVAVTSALHFLRENVRLQEQALTLKDLESRKLKAELDSLKAQINPHFLFNSLNNIYSHSLLESKQTPELILKLSGLLNYIIYECQDEFVRVEKEVTFLENYLDLERVRIDESVEVEINLDVANPDARIAPLLFVPLIENAFKHGASVSSQSPFIHVTFSQDSNGCTRFTCVNSKDPDVDEGKKRGGIGLENVRKRLDLIYPQRHRFHVENQGNQYRVEVELDCEERNA